MPIHNDVNDVLYYGIQQCVLVVAKYNTSVSSTKTIPFISTENIL